ncbi:hypothetical protein DH2020_046164 [Rehmannia glutinosa]|uniref:Uncharacterized protein n=1 Tax=Rehmannia glutinosa TaxID=99300 RepID=A0ABR0UBY0_REHGL
MWKLFKNKLSRSKANKKKPKNISYKTTKKLGWPSLSIQPKKLKTKPKHHHTLVHHRNRNHYLPKRPNPVFVDQLFVEPVSVMKESVRAPAVAMEESTSKEKIGVADRENRRPGSSKEAESVNIAADDMWESMMMASPQMHGINERAEDFIARFRAEMRHQEMMARRL